MQKSKGGVLRCYANGLELILIAVEAYKSETYSSPLLIGFS